MRRHTPPDQTVLVARAHTIVGGHTAAPTQRQHMETAFSLLAVSLMRPQAGIQGTGPHTKRPQETANGRCRAAAATTGETRLHVRAVPVSPADAHPPIPNKHAHTCATTKTHEGQNTKCNRQRLFSARWKRARAPRTRRSTTAARPCLTCPHAEQREASRRQSCPAVA